MSLPHRSASPPTNAHSASWGNQLQLAGVPSERASVAQLYAALMRERYGPSHPSDPGDVHWAFADSVLSRDVYALRHLTDALRNGCARQAFMKATGLTLPLGGAATWSVLLEWGGVSAQEDAARDAQARVEREFKALSARIGNAPEARKWAERQVAAGFHTLKKVRDSWWLISEAGEGFELSKSKCNLHRLRPLITALIESARAEAEAAS